MRVMIAASMHGELRAKLAPQTAFPPGLVKVTVHVSVPTWLIPKLNGSVPLMPTAPDDGIGPAHTLFAETAFAEFQMKLLAFGVVSGPGGDHLALHVAAAGALTVSVAEQDPVSPLVLLVTVRVQLSAPVWVALKLKPWLPFGTGAGLSE